MPFKQLTIVGDTALDVYDRVLADAGDGPFMNCLLQFPASGLEGLDQRYPRREGETSAEAVDQTVQWWQHPTVPAGPARQFNHGARIRGKDEDWNQIPKIVKELQRNSSTTKAHATLQSHRPGFAKTHGHPSMCDVFFALREEGGRIILDVTATFRKQELRHWWIINVYELAFLQNKVIEGLREGDQPVKASAGTIATFAFRAIILAKDEEPEVAIHALDRALLFRPDVVESLAANLIRVNLQGEYFLTWQRYLKDLIPTAQMNYDGFPVCVEGLAALLSNVRLLTKANNATLQPIVNSLDELLRENRTMVDAVDDSGLNEGTAKMYRRWRERCLELVEKTNRLAATQMRFRGSDDIGR